MDEISGFVDGLIGLQVHGWAIRPGDDGNCQIEVRDGTGLVLGGGRCGRSRADLAMLSHSRIDLGFLVSIERYGSGNVLHVMADGVELPGSPLPTGYAIFDGHFEIREDKAIGWVQRRSDDRTPPRITLTLPDGTLVGEAVADYDLDLMDRSFSPARFKIDLSIFCVGLTEFLVLAYADQVCFGRATGHLPLDGYIDYIGAECIAGWLLVPNAPDRRLVITAWQGETQVGRTVCDQSRLDLRGKYPKQWKAGFVLPVQATERRIETLATFTLRLDGSTRPLLDSPFITGHRVAFIAAAKGLAHAIQEMPSKLRTEEQALFQDMLSHYLGLRRQGSDYLRISYHPPIGAEFRPITVLVPVYKGVELTETCLRSVLHQLMPEDDLVVVADCPPEPAMMLMLTRFRSSDRITILKNEVNLGFVGSVNRGLDFCNVSDILLLNSDTQLFNGALKELRSVLVGADNIATVTAISNNATIFSYPHPRLACTELMDCTWRELAELALKSNAGRTVDVPTGHGFCMLIRREVLNRIGKLNVAFGRGYGEENELCLRASDLGYRHVAATGVLVQHCESVSFGDERLKLIEANLPQLEALYPEYTATIMAFEQIDPLRVARWTLDAYRLRRARSAGTRFVLTVVNSLPGGTGKAARDITRRVGYNDRTELRLVIHTGGAIWLESIAPALCAVFSPNEHDALIWLLETAEVELVVIHQLLGLRPGPIKAFARWIGTRRTVYYAHDFYPICPRVTMIDAVGRFCDVANTSICARCVVIAGSHETSVLTELTPFEHRALFQDLFEQVTAVVAPSHDAASYLRRVFKHNRILAIPHPGDPPKQVVELRRGNLNEIVLFGSVGPHKGSRALLDIATQALFSHPDLHFTVIGHTDIDHQLSKLSNVDVTGPYEPIELSNIVRRINPAAALFLHNWPETFSYTLSEAVSFGLLPIVPDIGAPAERLRRSNFGLIFSFPIVTAEVLSILGSLSDHLALAPAIVPTLDSLNSVSLIDALFNHTTIEDPVSSPFPGSDANRPWLRHVSPSGRSPHPSQDSP